MELFCQMYFKTNLAPSEVRASAIFGGVAVLPHELSEFTRCHAGCAPKNGSCHVDCAHPFYFHCLYFANEAS